MLRGERDGSAIRVEATQVGADKCRLLIEIERDGRLLLLLDRVVPMIDCDGAAVERSALELAKTDSEALLAVYAPNAPRHAPAHDVVPPPPNRTLTRSIDDAKP